MRVLELEPDTEPDLLVGIPVKVDEEYVTKRGGVGEISSKSC